MGNSPAVLQAEVNSIIEILRGSGQVFGGQLSLVH